MRATTGTFVLLFALLATPRLTRAQDKKELVTIVSTKRYILHFKVDKELIGGTVSIFDTDYKLVRSEDIKGKQNIVDFFDLPAGYYVVKIKKDEKEVNFQYVNFE